LAVREPRASSRTSSTVLCCKFKETFSASLTFRTFL
jgi:hypothetical protein